MIRWEVYIQLPRTCAQNPTNAARQGRPVRRLRGIPVISPLPKRPMRIYPIWDILYQGSFDSLVDALLAGRSLGPEDLEVGPDRLHPPELLVDLERGVERIQQAIRQGEKILIFGDYDVDGVASTTLLLEFLQQVGAHCDYLLPDRHVDGYGLKPSGVRKALEKNADLIVTVDNGIAAFEALELARSEGLDVVVVDHHQQHDTLPPAHSIINPNRRDCSYPFKGLAGVGVTFKVVQALSQNFMEAQERRRYLNDLLDLVALGTVADVVPVLDENRVFIQRGLEIMEKTRRPGLRQLKAVAGYEDKPLNTTVIGFYLGPRLNVAGRLASADLALELLRAPDEERAADLAAQLNALNGRRQKLQREGIQEAESLVGPDDLESDRIIILLGETWHLGVIGLLASRLANKYHCPAVVCTEARGDGTYTGSARSIPAYDISAGISACAEHLTAYGGHPGAAGLSMNADSFEAFRATLIDHAKAHISAADLKPRLRVDLMLRPQDIGLQTLAELTRLEPFGAGHETPVFALEHCEVVSSGRIGRGGDHFKMELNIGGRSCQALWWNQGPAADQVRAGQCATVAFVLEEDTFTGNGAVQLVVKDMYVEE